MTDIEKLRDLIGRVQDERVSYVDCFSDDDKPDYIGNYELADYLIANGVTFATDTNDGGKWIRVEDRMPDLIPCNAGTAYSEAVIVLTSGKKAMAAVWDGIDFLCAADYWEAWGENITHWMPLPEPPKEEPK